MKKFQEFFAIALESMVSFWTEVSSCVAWISPREESDAERKHDNSDEDPVLQSVTTVA